ncbi:hypothetical protein CHS0354_035983 [Potamilus streckersoni]|uniref:Uncharacterized protein n=1 Tax=Potamilus streckersoni TaxID=2493646 RepID=A0AAE0SB96_9BIVA|nr:hypothetical protein CHS0354_035983 [Potamilus streckersoni]
MLNPGLDFDDTCANSGPRLGQECICVGYLNTGIREGPRDHLYNEVQRFGLPLARTRICSIFWPSRVADKLSKRVRN